MIEIIPHQGKGREVNIVLTSSTHRPLLKNWPSTPPMQNNKGNRWKISKNDKKISKNDWTQSMTNASEKWWYFVICMQTSQYLYYTTHKNSVVKRKAVTKLQF